MELLCIDIGGAKFSCAISDEEGNLSKITSNTLYVGAGADRLVIQRIFEYTDRVIDRNPDIERIGISVPGLTDSDNGIWIYSPFSGIRNVNLRELFGQRYNIPVYCENDVNACALAEKRLGCCKDVNNFMWILLSNGIGGSLVINNKLFTGVRGNAGEIGHVIVDENGPACACGNIGCLEAMASSRAIENAYTALKPGESKGAEELAAFAIFGNEDLRSIFTKAGHYIGKAIASCTTLLDIDFYVLGGHVALCGYDLFEHSMAEAIKKYTFKDSSMGVTVRKTALGTNTALLGAATVALNGEEY